MSGRKQPIRRVGLQRATQENLPDSPREADSLVFLPASTGGVIALLWHTVQDRNGLAIMMTANEARQLSKLLRELSDGGHRL